MGPCRYTQANEAGVSKNDPFVAFGRIGSAGTKRMVLVCACGAPLPIEGRLELGMTIEPIPAVIGTKGPPSCAIAPASATSCGRAKTVQPSNQDRMSFPLEPMQAVRQHSASMRPPNRRPCCTRIKLVAYPSTPVKLGRGVVSLFLHSSERSDACPPQGAIAKRIGDPRAAENSGSRPLPSRGGLSTMADWSAARRCSTAPARDPAGRSDRQHGVEPLPLYLERDPA